jgi:uncharacterized membrane protein
VAELRAAPSAPALPVPPDRDTERDELAPGRVDRRGRRVPRAARVLLRPVRGFVRWLRLDFAGVIGAYWFFTLSLTPSLLPRSWIYQAALSGITVTIGYTTGWLVGCLVRLVKRVTAAHRQPPRRLVLFAWATAVTIGSFASAAYLLASSEWQTELTALMGRESPGPNHYLLVLGITAAMLLVFLALGRGVRGIGRWLHRLFGRRVPVPVAAAASVLCVAGVGFWAWTGLLYPTMMGAANSMFEGLNETTSETSVEPSSSLRSGGPGSLVSWDSLGRKGREFIGSGPSGQDIRAFSGVPAVEPVRAYVGIDAAVELDDRVDLAVRELDRMGAFERSVLVVATTTGTGWIDPAAADALEFLHAGDTAIVGIQYSYLPSWLSFLVDEDQAQAAGRALLDAVRSRWVELPESARPRLLGYGESLGAIGSTGAFDDLDDVLARVDGALWVGTPDSSALRRELTRGRDAGSTAVQPVVDEGRSVRFWNTHGDAPGVGAEWHRPRALFLQHASDPVAWWSPSLLWSKPAWLREPPAPDVLPTLSWFPFVTFWQITGDMAVAAQVPDGYGHRYAADHVDAWLALAPSETWPADRSEELRAVLREYCPVATSAVALVGTC